MDGGGRHLIKQNIPREMWMERASSDQTEDTERDVDGRGRHLIKQKIPREMWMGEDVI